MHISCKVATLLIRTNDDTKYRTLGEIDQAGSQRLARVSGAPEKINSRLHDLKRA